MTYKEIDNIVIVYDCKGNIKTEYNAIELAKTWFQCSNDSFFNRYGFNYIPSGKVYDIAKKQLGRS